MRAFLRDTNNITKRYAQDPYVASNRLSFYWLQNNTQQQQQQDIVLSLVSTGKPQLVQSFDTIEDIFNYAKVDQKSTLSMTIQGIKANAVQLYRQAVGAN